MGKVLSFLFVVVFSGPLFAQNFGGDCSMYGACEVNPVFTPGPTSGVSATTSSPANPPRPSETFVAKCKAAGGYINGGTYCTVMGASGFSGSTSSEAMLDGLIANKNSGATATSSSAPAVQNPPPKVAEGLTGKFPDDCKNKGGYYLAPYNKCEINQQEMGETEFYQRYGNYNQQTASSDSPAGSPCAVAEQKVQECEASAADAVDSSCNPKTNPELSSAVSMADKMTLTLTALSSANMSAACSKMGDITTLANTALLGFKATCTAAQSSCSDICAAAAQVADAVKSDPSCSASNLSSRIKTSKGQCIKTNDMIKSASANVAGLMASKLMAQQCQALTNNTLCKQNPSLPICSGQSAITTNCANPSDNSTICICQRNPRDPVCGTNAQVGQLANPSVNGSNGSGSAGANGLTGNALTLGDGLGGLGSGVDSLDSGSKGSSDRAGGMGKGGGAGRNISGGEAPQTAGNGKNAAGSGRPEVNSKVNNGFYGGGGGGGYPGASGGGGSGYGGYGGAGGLAKENVDLRQFMPGGRLDPKRGVASGVGPDGLTGQGTDLWQKVNSRYWAVSKSMKP